MLTKLVLRLAPAQPPPQPALRALLGQPLDLATFDPEETGRIAIDGYDAIRTGETVTLEDQHAHVYTLIKHDQEPASGGA